MQEHGTEDQIWYMYSGATNHIINELSNLSISSDYTGTEGVIVGNGNRLHISFVGSSSIPLSNHLSSSKPLLLLHNMLYVPDITKNLLSISQFTLHNYVLIEFHHDCCLVKDKATQMILLKGLLVNGLYQLDLSKLSLKSAALCSNLKSCSASDSSSSLYSTCVPSPSINSYVLSNESSSTSSVSSINHVISYVNAFVTNKITDMNVLPIILGHPSHTSLSKVCSLMKIPFSVTGLSFYEACKIGKMHQFPHTSKPIKTTKIFDLVHTDVWGPAFSLSSHGFKYYIHFVDDFTR